MFRVPKRVLTQIPASVNLRIIISIDMKSNNALIVLTNHSDFEKPKAAPTGLWFSELTHFYDEFEKNGFTISLASPNGGKVPVDERSLGKVVLDKSAQKRYKNKEFMALLENTKGISEVNYLNYDIVFFAGGHGAMWDFADNHRLQELTRRMYESGKVVSAVCHGVAALQNVKLSSGEYLIKGKRGTGFPYFDESIAGVKKYVPYNLQQRLKDRGMLYSKALIPLQNHVVVDDRLVTGQNPNSTTMTARKALEVLNKI